MLSLRGALQRSVRNASILGGSPLCHQTPGSSSVICVLRQAHSKVLEEDKKSEEADNESMNRRISRFAEALGMPIPPDIANDPEAKATSSNADRNAFKPRRAYSKVQKSEKAENESMDERISRFAEAIGMPIPPDITNDPGANATSSNADSKALNTTQKPRQAYSKVQKSEKAENESMDERISRFAEAVGMPIPPDIVSDPKTNATLANADNKALNTTQKPRQAYSKASKAPKNGPGKISPIAESETLNTSKNSKHLEFRRYHIFVCGFSETTTEDMLREFYSKFGQVINCRIVHDSRHKTPVAYVVFSSKESMDRALEPVAHVINDKKVFVDVGTCEHELKLRVLNLSPETTEDSLEQFYFLKFGLFTECKVNKNFQTGSKIGYVTFGSHEDLDRALDTQPQVIDGSEVFIKYASGELDLGITEVPEGITEESLRTFFSKTTTVTGPSRELQLTDRFHRPAGSGPGYLPCKCQTAGTWAVFIPVNRAMEDRPHVIDKQILRTDFIGKRGLFPIFVGSLPKNATLGSLFKPFSQFGKIVHLEILNDGHSGFVSYGTEEEVNNVLKNGPHTVEGAPVRVRTAIPSNTNNKSPQNTVNDLRMKKDMSIADTKPSPDMFNDRESNQTSSITDSKALNKSQIRTKNKIPSTAHNKPLPETVNSPLAEMNPSIADSKALNKTKSRANKKAPSSAHNKPLPETVNSPETNPLITQGKALNKTKSSKNLELRKYHILVRGFSKAMTEDMLREFYSKFGQVINCRIMDGKQFREPHAYVVFSSKKSMNNAVNSPTHRINNEKVSAKVGYNEHELTLRVLNLSPETTEESLRKFYSRFGSVKRCEVKKNSETGESKIGYVAFASHENLDRALDAQPHFIDGSEVFLKYAAGDLDLEIKNVPEGITEETLRAFFSKYGRLRQCQCHVSKVTGRPQAYVSFSAIDEVNRAMEDRPHVIDQKILRTEFMSKSGTFSLFVGSLPENADRISLFKAFSKFGKIVHLELHNDGGMDQRGPYGFVSYGTKEEADKALNTRPHKVEGSVVNVRIASEIIDKFKKN
ncbi:RNA recognition motif domain-containing protein [Ditylenchus destructor]|nr:RNA recognition motif domain-containing protein [Ditylenchus destructor]